MHSIGHTKISPLPIWHYIMQSLDRKLPDQNNVNNNKMVFSADDLVLIKLLRQVLKSLSQNFPASLSGHCQD